MDHGEDSDLPPYKKGDIRFLLDTPDNTTKAFLQMQAYVNYVAYLDPDSNKPRPLSHDEQKSILSKEMKMMRGQVEIYFGGEITKQINKKK